MLPQLDPVAEADMFIAAGKPQRAVEILQRALALGRGGLMTRLALGRAHLAAGSIDSALSELRIASDLGPGIADAALALGQALMAAGHLPAAVAEFERALRLDPAFDGARYALGSAWLEAGEPDRAIEILSPLAQGAFATDAREKLSLARAMKESNRSPPGYVRHLFDQFSSDYDARMLGALDYRGHLILRELADLVLMEPKGLDILDLGCGTGLTGAEFAPIGQSTLAGMESWGCRAMVRCVRDGFLGPQRARGSPESQLAGEHLESASGGRGLGCSPRSPAQGESHRTGDSTLCGCRECFRNSATCTCVRRVRFWQWGPVVRARRWGWSIGYFGTHGGRTPAVWPSCRRRRGPGRWGYGRS
jgi:predicted TPR repeat methyltransferase